MNRLLEEIAKTQQVRPVDGGDSIPLKDASISNEEGVFLQELVRKGDPKVTLEIGLAYGVSALYICDALKVREGTRHIAVDPHQHHSGPIWGGIGLANLQRAGFGDIVQLIEKSSHLALPELEAAGQEVDFAFIDGWHTFDFTLIDFFYVDHMLRVGGIVAFDDADWPAVRKLCRFVATNYAYSVVGCCGGYAASWRRKKVARFVRNTPLARWCSPEILHPDWELGLQGSCIAFRKERNDDRNYDHFREF